MVTAAIPLPTRSKGVVVPVVEEDNPNMYMGGQDPAIDTMFDEANVLRTAGDGSSAPQIDRQGCISNPSHSPEFFTLPTISIDD